MEIRIQFSLFVACCTLVAIAGAPVEETKSYEFEFDIGTQHRKEKKGDDGIVIGEYGFWTADNYYNIVEYATDLEGRFIITGRRRIPLKLTTPAPAEPTEDPEEAARAAAAAAAAAEPTTTTTTTTERVKIYQFEYDTKNETNIEAHGHREMGFSDTSKMGDYYWDGPDNIRRTIVYTADDEGGYRVSVKESPVPEV